MLTDYEGRVTFDPATAPAPACPTCRSSRRWTGAFPSRSGTRR
ncbi:hypothetical protein MSS93_05035 [Deinococcus radiodurans]|nr:hypothetical protein MSS93_05035 [Deinococcus radiodurans]